MTQAHEVIERILAQAREKDAGRHASKVYEDEPIIRTGADLARERAARERARGDAERAFLAMPGAGGRVSRPAAPFPRRRERGTASRRAAAREPLQDFLPQHRFPDEPDRAAPPCELPPLLRELRALERANDPYSTQRDRLFVRQARLAADYEDDYAFEGSFHHYFPTYQAMTDAQLRGYFAWRTSVRRGAVRKTSLSFAFVYLYELINGIGAPSPEAGYERLLDFWRAYRALDDGIDRYVRIWLHDYVVYHGLDLALLALDPPADPRRDARLAPDRALGILLAAAEPNAQAAAGPPKGSGERPGDGQPSDDELFAALCALSTYHLDASRLFRDEPDLARRGACAAWRASSAYYRAHRRRTLFENLFGLRSQRPYPLFRSAVFFGEAREGETVYEESPARRFVCRSRRWSEDAFHAAVVPNRDLGRILKALDCALRERCGSAHPLKPPDVPKYVRTVIGDVVDGLIEERRRASLRRVDIDFSKLAGIRAAAAETREALLVEEEREDGKAPEGGGAAAAGGSPEADASGSGGRPGADASGSGGRPGADASGSGSRPGADDDTQGDPNATPENDAPFPAPAVAPADNPGGNTAADEPAKLSEAERSYVRCLLEGASAPERAALAARMGMFESLLADAVNEKLYDALGDVAIEDAEGGPAVVADYEYEIREMLGL